MKMQIVICDDEQQEGEYLRELVLHCCDGEAEVLLFHGGGQLLAAWKLQQLRPSMVFLDIYIREENGMDVAAEIRRRDKNIPIVFITSSREHAIEAFAMRAFHYLVKPVQEQQMREIFKLYNERGKAERPVLIVPQGRDSIRLLQEKIHYLQSQNKVTRIHTKEGDIPVARPLREVALKLNGQFLKIQRGIVVNMNFISRMNTDSCELKDGQTILISRNDRSKIRQTYKEFIYNKAMGREEF